jgi:hypothetical protein
MREFLIEHLVHVVALATLISRLGDIGTTFLVSPTLSVEANPIARRFGWKYIFATAAVALVPYRSIHGGIMVLTTSFLIAALNASEAMLARFLGEGKYAALHREAMQKMPALLGLSLLCLPAMFFAMLGLMIFILFPNSSGGWGFDIAMGNMLCAAALLILYPIRFFSERRQPNKEPTEPFCTRV